MWRTLVQHASRVSYVKRMPRRKRKAWVSFSKKVKAVDLTQLPKSTFRTTVLRRWSSGNGQQYVDGFAFRPGEGDPGSGCDDIAALSQYTADALGFNLKDATSSADRQALDFQSNGPRIASFILDISLSNMLSSTAYIDMYEVTVRQDLPYSFAGNERQVWTTVLSQHSALANTYNGGDVKPSTSTFGTKLFDVKEFTSKFKINKVETITLPGNGSCVRQWREPRNIRVGMNTYQNVVFHKGDKMLFFIIRGPPGLNSTTQVFSTPTDIVAQCVRTYKWCMPGYNFSSIQTRNAGP